MFHNSILIVEPMRGQQLMVFLNTWVVNHPVLVKVVPITADIFVFTYPLFLVLTYLSGIVKKEIQPKYTTLFIAIAAGIATLINQIIQYFGDKARPETAIVLKQNLILNHLPTDPFPSDHAAVSAAFACAVLICGIRAKDNVLIARGIFFLAACLVMSFSRVAVAIHRPTDILVGMGVGITSAYIVYDMRKKNWMQTFVGWIINIEKRVLLSVFRIRQ